MEDRKAIYLTRPAVQRRFDVNPTIPTIFLLMADLSVTHNTNDWSKFCMAPKDPLWRIGKNWPREDPQTTSFIRSELENALKEGYEIDQDIIALGKAALVELSEFHRTEIADINANKGKSLFVSESEHQLPGSQQAITSVCVSDHLPEDFSLPFIGPGTLVFQDQPLRLIGLEFSIGLIKGG